MRKFLNGLLLGVILGAGTLWFYLGPHSIPGMQETERLARVQAGKALQSAQDAAERAQQVLGARLDALDLSPDAIRKEAAETGKVVRQRARDLGEVVADATADARITAAVKARLAADPELSALAITVDTTDGRVTLAGTVAAPELVGRAMALTLETEGVRAVVSTLQVN